MGKNLCINCMKEIDDVNGSCPVCGYSQKQNEQNPVALKPGTILKGRYYVGRVLGQGGFGITYVGCDLTLNIKVAIKEYFPMGFATRNHTYSNQIQWNTTQFSIGQWQQGSENFLKEARRMAILDSLPGIVRVRDTFSDNKTSYIVMDFVEGETLKNRLGKTGVMSINECMQLLTPLMQSLGKVHQKGLVHRDISPDNIMIKPDGSACLIDFGAAKDVSMHQNAASQQITKKGFSPPEQYMEKGSIGSWTDIYAFSAMIYYCITGRMVPDAIERTYGDTLSFDVPFKEALSESQITALKEGMSLRPEQRIQTMEELLSRVTSKGPAPEPAPTPAPAPEPTPLPDPISSKVKIYGIVSLVCGILTVITLGCWIFPEILAIIFGNKTKGADGKRTKLGKAGFICGIVGIVIIVLAILVYLI